MGWSPDQPTAATEGLLFIAGWFSNPIVGLLIDARRARRRPDGRASGLVRRPAHNEEWRPRTGNASSLWIQTVPDVVRFPAPSVTAFSFPRIARLWYTPHSMAGQCTPHHIWQLHVQNLNSF